MRHLEFVLGFMLGTAFSCFILKDYREPAQCMKQDINEDMNEKLTKCDQDLSNCESSNEKTNNQLEDCYEKLNTGEKK